MPLSVALLVTPAHFSAAATADVPLFRRCVVVEEGKVRQARNTRWRQATCTHIFATFQMLNSLGAVQNAIP